MPPHDLDWGFIKQTVLTQLYGGSKLQTFSASPPSLLTPFLLWNPVLLSVINVVIHFTVQEDKQSNSFITWLLQNVCIFFLVLCIDSSHSIGQLSMCFYNIYEEIQYCSNIVHLTIFVLFFPGDWSRKATIEAHSSSLGRLKVSLGYHESLWTKWTKDCFLFKM